MAQGERRCRGQWRGTAEARQWGRAGRLSSVLRPEQRWRIAQPARPSQLPGPEGLPAAWAEAEQAGGCPASPPPARRLSGQMQRRPASSPCWPQTLQPCGPARGRHPRPPAPVGGERGGRRARRRLTRLCEGLHSVVVAEPVALAAGAAGCCVGKALLRRSPPPPWRAAQPQQAGRPHLRAQEHAERHAAVLLAVVQLVRHHNALHGRQLRDGAHREAAVHQAIVHKPAAQGRGGGSPVASRRSTGGGGGRGPHPAACLVAPQSAQPASWLPAAGLTCRRCRRA